METITYKDIRNNEEVNALIERGNAMLGVMGYTEHSHKHAVKIAIGAGSILSDLGYDKRLCELARIAGYLHDIGNCVNREDHPHSGAILAFQILRDLHMDPQEVALVVSAIGQHDESTGVAVDPVSAAVILADKTDVRRNRVRNRVKARFDKHDRVNYAAVSSKLSVCPEKKTVKLDIELDENICSILDYFEIFLGRMLMCKRAAEVLGLKFRMNANGHKVC
ncbi:HD domain-containing protein [Intestinibacillus sp. Marseille-P6563]|uniref:HD domain-containing protein n=1 Tax=Intestinibacillus sp. Marseille-P6563 TaxID=2364792 RepID=UPI000F047585|nr:HD domain-containing protein [Intestinibacillus sp. Marseille-P6563]